MQAEHRFEMLMPDDLHLHLRELEMLLAVIKFTANHFNRAIIMPNLEKDPVLNAKRLREYTEEVLAGSRGTGFQPLMTIQVTERTTKTMVYAARDAGAIAGKIYPLGMTTNSENGVMNYDLLREALRAMADCGMLALFHGESPEHGIFCLDREARFLKTLAQIIAYCRGLKIVMEHVTTEAAVAFIQSCDPDYVGATVTVHHPILTLDDIIGKKLMPHNFCKPVAKRPEDRDAVLNAILTGDRHFFLGTDSAVHPKDKKECNEGCAGIFSAPVAMPVLIELFGNNGCLGMLENFCSRFGPEFYGLPVTSKKVVYIRKPWKVPPMYGNAVPYKAGETLLYQPETAFVELAA